MGPRPEDSLVNIDSILISNYAHSENGKLTVVGVFNHAITNEAPVRIPLLFLSLVIHAHPDEAGTSHKGHIRLLNARREVVREDLEFEFTFGPREAAIPGLPFRAVHTLGIMFAEFPELGPYAFEVYLDDTYSGGAAFYVGPAR